MGLAQNKHALYKIQIAGMHECSLAEVTLAGLALLGKQVALKRLIAADFARTGYFKRLLGT